MPGAVINSIQRHARGGILWFGKLGEDGRGGIRDGVPLRGRAPAAVPRPGGDGGPALRPTSAAGRQAGSNLCRVPDYRARMAQGVGSGSGRLLPRPRLAEGGGKGRGRGRGKGGAGNPAGGPKRGAPSPGRHAAAPWWRPVVHRAGFTCRCCRPRAPRGASARVTDAAGAGRPGRRPRRRPARWVARRRLAVRRRPAAAARPLVRPPGVAVGRPGAGRTLP
jgi:hypothetical protein